MGIAGMKAALDLAGCGIRVIVVESSGRLGGHLNECGRIYPSESVARNLATELAKQVQHNANIELLGNRQLLLLSGESLTLIGCTVCGRDIYRGHRRWDSTLIRDCST